MGSARPGKDPSAAAFSAIDARIGVWLYRLRFHHACSVASFADLFRATQRVVGNGRLDHQLAVSAPMATAVEGLRR